MTLENNLERIAVSLEAIAAALSAKAAPVASAPAAPVVVATPVVAPAIVAAPVALPVVTPAPTPMPPAPVFTQAAPIPVAHVMPVAVPTPVAASPFNDKAAMMDYVVSSYKALGPEKGARIQEVLNGMGVQNINEVAPERWGELKAGIEALKG